MEVLWPVSPHRTPDGGGATLPAKPRTVFGPEEAGGSAPEEPALHDASRGGAADKQHLVT